MRLLILAFGLVLTDLAGMAGASGGHYVSPKGFHLNGSPHSILGEAALLILCLVFLLLFALDATRSAPSHAPSRTSATPEISLLILGGLPLAVGMGVLLGRLLFFGFDAITLAALVFLAITGLVCLLAISPAAREHAWQAVRSTRRAWRPIRDAWWARLRARQARPKVRRTRRKTIAWWQALPDSAQVAVLALMLAVPAGLAAVVAFASRRP
jgi:hypothetical protein